MDIYTLLLFLIIVNIILDLAVLRTVVVLINRNAHRLRVVQQQLVVQSNLVERMIGAMSQAEYESPLVQLREPGLEAVLAALKRQPGIVQ
jgi:hypothetical protein